MSLDTNHSENLFPTRRFTLKPGAVVLLLMLLAAGVMVTPMYDGFSEIISALPTRTQQSWIFASSFMAVYLAGIVAHEGGHVAAAVSVGGRLERVIIGARVGVALDVPDRRTNMQQLRISFSGPAAQTLLGSLVVALGWPTLPWGSSLLVAGLVMLAEGLLNLLLPFGRNSDAAKLYRSLWHCLRGRADSTFALSR